MKACRRMLAVGLLVSCVAHQRPGANSAPEASPPPATSHPAAPDPCPREVPTFPAHPSGEPDGTTYCCASVSNLECGGHALREGRGCVQIDRSPQLGNGCVGGLVLAGGAAGIKFSCVGEILENGIVRGCWAR